MPESKGTSRMRARAAGKATVLLLGFGLAHLVIYLTLWSYLRVRWSPHGRAIHAAQGTRVAYLSEGLAPIILPDVHIGPLENLHLDWELLKGFCWRFSIRDQRGGGADATVSAHDLDHLQPLDRLGEVGARLPIDAILILPPVLLLVFLAMSHYLQKERCSQSVTEAD